MNPVDRELQQRVDRDAASGIRCSIVVTVHGRAEALAHLLQDLALQTVAASELEVIVIESSQGAHAGNQSATRNDAGDDGVRHPFRKINLGRGPSHEPAGRDEAVRIARGSVVLLLADHMRVGPRLVDAHLRAHSADRPLVVVGEAKASKFGRLPLHVRHQLRSRHQVGQGSRRAMDLTFANVSLRRADYLSAGGSASARGTTQDAELAWRMQRLGVAFTFCAEAVVELAGEIESFEQWRIRTRESGVFHAKMTEEHSQLVDGSPWDHAFELPALSRGLVLRAARAPRPSEGLAMRVAAVARTADVFRLTRPAMSAITLAHGLFYYGGVRAGAGSAQDAVSSLDQYLNGRDDRGLGLRGRLMKMRAAVRADHRALRRADATYAPSTDRHGAGILSTFVQRIGFQMMVAYRIMRFLRGARLGLLARLVSRSIRHLYASDIHWDADLAPGVIIVHGTGLVISHAARIGAGSILFQHVTLGVNIDPVTRETGAPWLEENVHVGPGAVLLGPIVIGRGTKIMANALLMRSTPPGSRVETVEAVVRLRENSGGTPTTRPTVGPE